MYVYLANYPSLIEPKSPFDLVALTFYPMVRITDPLGLGIVLQESFFIGYASMIVDTVISLSIFYYILFELLEASCLVMTSKDD